VKKRINAVRIESNYIGEQVKTPNYRSINQILLQIKKTSNFNSLRSTADAEPNRSLFKLPLWTCSFLFFFSLWWFSIDNISHAAIDQRDIDNPSSFILFSYKLLFTFAYNIHIVWYSLSSSICKNKAREKYQ